MILSQEAWMELRAFRGSGRGRGHVGRESPGRPGTIGERSSVTCRPMRARAAGAGRRGPGPRKIDPYAHLVDGWLAKQPKLKAVTIYERLVAEHGFDGHYQRVKVYVRENRARLTQAEPEPAGFHRRFEVLAGAQAQVDWGDEGEVQTAGGPLHAFSFHMVLSYSRDPFCCYVASQDLASFWDCHRRGFAHFGGVPAAIVYDRTKTVVGRHVGCGQAPRCIPRRSRSPATTSSRSGCARRGGHKPKAGSSGRSRSCGPTCWMGASSTRLGRWIRPSWAATPPRSRPSHPRRGDRRACRTRPGRHLPAARAALCGV